MILKDLIEELQRAVPIVGEDAPIEVFESLVQGVSSERGRVTLLSKEPDPDDFPTIKDAMEALRGEIETEATQNRKLKDKVRQYIQIRDDKDEAQRIAECRTIELREVHIQLESFL